MKALEEFASDKLLYDYLYDYYKTFCDFKEWNIQDEVLFSRCDSILEYEMKTNIQDYTKIKKTFHWFLISDFIYRKFTSEIQSLKDEIKTLKDELNTIKKAPN